MTDPGTLTQQTSRFMTTGLLGDSVSTILEAGPLPAEETEAPDRGQLRRVFGGLVNDRSLAEPVTYRLERQIGKGRQGIVFEAHRHGSRGCVTRHAVKLFDPAIYRDAGSYWHDMERIATQVSRLQVCRSPHLVGCDVYQESGGVGCLQMELINGLNLMQLLESRRFAAVRGRKASREWRQFLGVVFNTYEDRLCVQPGVAVYIMRQMLHGLEALHSAQYLHCDIKPLNVMIDLSGYVKLIDLGRATSVADPSGPLLGTPMYIAPELHDRALPSIQADIYSVGLVGLELLSGRHMLETVAASGGSLREAKAILPQRFEATLPPYVRCNRELVTILRRFLHPDPQFRFPSVQAAETSTEGLAMVHRQLTRMDIDTDYRRDLAAYVQQAAAF